MNKIFSKKAETNKNELLELDSDNLSTCDILVNKNYKEYGKNLNWKQKLVYNYKVSNEIQAISFSPSLNNPKIDMKKIEESVLKNKFLR